MTRHPSLTAFLQSIRPKLFFTTLIAGALSLWGYFLNPSQFHSAYLINFMFFLSITAGSLPMIGLHHLTAGDWGFPVRRVMEYTINLIPLFAILFLPIFFHLDNIYLWAKPEAAHDTILQAKSVYLNSRFFLTRAGIYLLIWTVLGMLLLKNSKAFDQSQDSKIASRLQILGGFTLVLYGLTVSFSAIDWVMSLEPHWYSTIYGVFYMIGDAIAGFCFAILISLGLSAYAPFSKIVNSSRSHDLGNLLFAMVLLWAYIHLSQFIIIWSGNLPEEITWYIRRSNGGWLAMAGALALFHFFVPFFLLLTRAVKQTPSRLCRVALALLFFHWLDLFWFIKPAFFEKLTGHWLDITLFLAMGSLWLLVWIHKTKSADFMLSHDPVQDAAHEGHH